MCWRTRAKKEQAGDSRKRERAAARLAHASGFKCSCWRYAEIGEQSVDERCATRLRRGMCDGTRQGPAATCRDQRPVRARFESRSSQVARDTVPSRRIALLRAPAGSCGLTRALAGSRGLSRTLADSRGLARQWVAVSPSPVAPPSPHTRPLPGSGHNASCLPGFHLPGLVL